MKKFLKDNLNILVLICGVILGLAILDSGYYSSGFYMFLRIIVTACFAWIGYRKFIANSASKLLVIYGLIIILFNPFIIIELDKSTWINIDLITGLILFIYLVKTIIHLIKSETKESDTSITVNEPKKMLSIILISFILMSAVGNSSKIYSVESDINEQIENIPDMSDSVSNLESSMSDIESNVSDVSSRVDDLESRLSY